MVMIILCIFLLVLSVFLFIFRSLKISKYSNENFSRLADIGYFDNADEALELLEIGKPLVATKTEQAPIKPYKRGFLLIGGFGDTPAMWTSLIDFSKIQSETSFCYAPRTLGWGRTNFDEAQKVRWQDWVVAALEALEVVCAVSEDVVIVGHSTGAIIAMLVLQRARPKSISRCVLTGPNLCSPSDDLPIKNILLHPIVGSLLIKMMPLVPKKLREDRPVDCLNWRAYPRLFYHTAFPLSAVREMWRMQDAFLHSDKPLKALKDEVVLLMGEHDKSVGPLETSTELVRKVLPAGVNIISQRFCGAAHNLYGEKEEVANQVLRIIWSNFTAN